MSQIITTSAGGGGGTITAVDGTANQIDVSTTAGVATVSLDPAIITPGSVTIGSTLTSTAGLTTLGVVTQTGAFQVNISVGSPSTIGTGGTGPVYIGNPTGNTYFTGQIFAEDGTNANKGIAISGDTGTGIYSRGSGDISIGVSGGEMIRIQNTQITLNVGGFVLIGCGIVTSAITSPGSYPYTTLNTDYIILVDTSSARTINLIATPNTGQTYYIKDNVGSALTNHITVSPAAGNIDGSSSYTILTAYGFVGLVYNGTQWNVISKG
jgi:hypothetical protein